MCNVSKLSHELCAEFVFNLGIRHLGSMTFLIIFILFKLLRCTRYFNRISNVVFKSPEFQVIGILAFLDNPYNSMQNQYISKNETTALVREGDIRTRQVEEAIHIKRRSSAMNRDQGGPASYHGPTTLFWPLTIAAAEIAELTGSSQVRARKKDEMRKRYSFIVTKNCLS